MQGHADLARLFSDSHHSHLLGAGNYLSNIDILQSQWYSFWTQVSLFYSNFFFAPLIGVYCAFLWRFENFHSCRNTLLTQPLRFSTIYCSKYVMVCVITLLTQLWFTVLYLIAGKVVGLPGLPPIDILGWIFRGTIGGWVIATIQYLVASVISNLQSQSLSASSAESPACSWPTQRRESSTLTL